MQPPPPPSPVQPAGPARTGSRLLGIVGVILGLAGLVAGVAAWFRAGPPREAAVPAYSEQQVIDAKTAVCEAYTKGMRSIHAVGSKSPEPADWFPIAINTRLAEFAVGTYLIETSNENPAAPPELQEQLRRLGQAYRDVALVQLADGSDHEYSASKEAVESTVPKIRQTCQ